MNSDQQQFPRCEISPSCSSSQFKCSRCLAAFCSVAGFNVHSSTCTDTVEADSRDRLHGIRASPEMQIRMRKILAEMNENDDRDGSSFEHGGQPTGPQERHSHGDRWSCDSDDSHAEKSEDVTDIDDLEELLEQWDRNEEPGENVGEESASCSVRGLRNNAGEADIADCLETLLHDMVTMELGFEEAIDRLPEELAEDFFRKVNDGTILELVPTWRPWWLQDIPRDARVCTNRAGSSNIDDADDCHHNDDEHCELMFHAAPPPQLQDSDFDLPPAEARARASPAVLFSTVDVIASYCLSLRCCNGDWKASPNETAFDMCTKSRVLNTDARFDSVAAAAAEFKDRCKSESVPASQGLHDASVVLRNKENAVRALVDAAALMRAAGRSCRRSARKIGFLAAWTAGSPAPELQNMGRELEAWLAVNSTSGSGAGDPSRPAVARRSNAGNDA